MIIEKITSKSGVKWMTLSAVIVSVAATAVRAQNATPSSTTAAEASTPVLTEVVVTARKRTESVQDVPLSVDVVGAAQLQQNQVRDFKDILRDIPGVSFSGAEFGQSSYNIRGISTNSSSPTVGIYLDDISLLTVATAFSGAADPVFFDINRVEVLKGPQGTLYGGSAMGGAIKYVSQLPQLSTESLDMATSVSSTAHGGTSYDAQGVFNLPIIQDTLAVRGGLLYRSDAGYIDNVANAPFVSYTQASTSPPAAFAPSTAPSLSTRSVSNQNYGDLLGIRLSALWQPDPSLQVIPSIFYQDYRQANPSVFWTNLPDFQSSFRSPQPTKDALAVDDLTVVKKFDGIELTSLTGYVDRSLQQTRDYSFYVGGLVPPLYGLDSPNQSNTYTHTISEEFRVASDASDSEMHWIVGLFYSDQNDTLEQNTETIGAGAILGTGTDVVYFGSTSTSTRQYALFGDATYTVLPKLDLSIGFRAFRIEQAEDVAAGGLFNGGSTATSGNSAENGLDPKFEVSYRATEDDLVYASAAKGFRPGGVNSSFSSSLCQADLQQLGLRSAPTEFQSDKLWTYELGSKNQFLDRRVTLNAAVYYTDWSGIQQTILLPSCGFAFTGNVGAATVKGAELGAQVKLTQELVVGSGLSYTDSEITKTSPDVTAQVGQPVLDSPKWIGNAFVGYTFPVASDSAEARVDYQYHGSQLSNFASTYTAAAANGSPESVPNFNQYLKGYGLVNLNLTLVHQHWEYGLFVNNLLDASPIIDFNPTNTFTQALTVRPRTIGLNVRAHFQ